MGNLIDRVLMGVEGCEENGCVGISAIAVSPDTKKSIEWELRQSSQFVSSYGGFGNTHTMLSGFQVQWSQHVKDDEMAVRHYHSKCDANGDWLIALDRFKIPMSSAGQTGTTVRVSHRQSTGLSNFTVTHVAVTGVAVTGGTFAIGMKMNRTAQVTVPLAPPPRIKCSTPGCVDDELLDGLCGVHVHMRAAGLLIPHAIKVPKPEPEPVEEEESWFGPWMGSAGGTLSMSRWTAMAGTT